MIYSEFGQKITRAWAGKMGGIDRLRGRLQFDAPYKIDAVKEKHPVSRKLRAFKKCRTFQIIEHIALLNALVDVGLDQNIVEVDNFYRKLTLMESFWGILRNELVYHWRFKARQQGIRENTEYIAIFYNRQLN